MFYTQKSGTFFYSLSLPVCRVEAGSRQHAFEARSRRFRHLYIYR